jgi:hypothetical protein
MIRHQPPFLKPGDMVIVTQTHRRPCPSKRATAVYPEPRGEDYCYTVQKYWIVLEVQPDGVAKFLTRRGKIRYLTATNPAVRRASFWERIFYRGRFASAKSLRANRTKQADTARTLAV